MCCHHRLPNARYSSTAAIAGIYSQVSSVPMFKLPRVDKFKCDPQEALALASLSKRSLTLPGMGSDWEIDPDELEICRRSDGTEWELGSGASARVGSLPNKKSSHVELALLQDPAPPSASVVLTLPPQLQKGDFGTVFCDPNVLKCMMRLSATSCTSTVTLSRPFCTFV